MIEASARPARARAIAGSGDMTRHASGATWFVAVPADEPVFRGHYPGNPILPGVYTLDLMQQCVELHFLETGQVATLKRVKSFRFTAPIGPGDCLAIRVDLQLSDNRVAVQGAVSVGERRAAAARLEFDVRPLG